MYTCIYLAWEGIGDQRYTILRHLVQQHHEHVHCHHTEFLQLSGGYGLQSRYIESAPSSPSLSPIGQRKAWQSMLPAHHLAGIHNTHVKAYNNTGIVIIVRLGSYYYFEIHRLVLKLFNIYCLCYKLLCTLHDTSRNKADPYERNSLRIKSDCLLKV